MLLMRVLVIGTAFGFILTKGEVVSWFRIQEMFRFQSFHMYGVLFSAVAVAALSVALIRWLSIRSIDGEEIRISPKRIYWGNPLGGFLFGLGWALTGACPGPLYTLIGNGFTIMAVALLSALLGTWVYGVLREKLPH